MRFLCLLILLSTTTYSQSNKIALIKPAKNDKYTNQSLRRRVWDLEKAVAQLQKQIAAGSLDQKFTCYLKSFGKIFTSTRDTETQARANVLRDCTEKSSSIHCLEKNINCGN